MKRSSAKL